MDTLLSSELATAISAIRSPVEVGYFYRARPLPYTNRYDVKIRLPQLGRKTARKTDAGNRQERKCFMTLYGTREDKTATGE